MKKSSRLFDVFSKIVFNQRGEVGEQDSSNEAPAQEQTSESQPEQQDSQNEQPVVQASNEKELESEIADAIKDGASKEDIKSMIRQFTLKVNGREVVKEIDLNNEENIKNELQMAAAGRGAMQENAQLKKLYSQELQRFRQDPFTVLKELDPNFDPLELSASYLESYFKEQEIPEEERNRISKEKEFQKMKEEKEALEKKIQDAENARALAEVQKEVINEISQALKDDNELVEDEETIALVAENIIWAAEQGMQMSAKEVLPQVKKQLREQFQRTTNKFKSTTALKEYMGSELLEKLREERLEQMKQVKNVSNVKQTVTRPKEDKEEKREKIPLSRLFR